MNKRAGPTLRELREQNKNTAAEVAEALGVAVSTYYNYEQGLRKIGLEQILPLAAFYDVSAEEITSPVNGNVVATAEVADETFASEMLGTTVAVEPTDGKIVAPCDGEVMNIFDTGHAVCIATEAGAELLIHIGIDTVSMDGKGFVKKVADGAKVRKGDVLIEADLDAIKAAGHPATTMMILTNADDFSKVEKTAAGTVTTADLAM